MTARLQNAERLHHALTAELADLRRAERAALLHFATIQRERLYRELGYASIHAYGREGLGFSERKLSAFVRLAEALERLPATRQAVAAGTLPWTKARELVAVVTPANEARWLAEATALSRRELERRVRAARARPAAQRHAEAGQPALALVPTPAQTVRSELEAATPLRLTLSFTPEPFGRWEALLESLRKAGRREPREELLLAALAALADADAAPQADLDRAAPAAGEPAAAAEATRPRGRVAAQHHARAAPAHPGTGRPSLPGAGLRGDALPRGASSEGALARRRARDGEPGHPVRALPSTTARTRRDGGLDRSAGDGDGKWTRLDRGCRPNGCGGGRRARFALRPRRWRGRPCSTGAGAGRGFFGNA